MRILQRLTNTLAAQRGYLFPWAPVCLGIGIGLYFQLATEPSRNTLIYVISFAFVNTLLSAWGPQSLRPIAVGIALICCGLVLAAFRAHSVDTPKMQFRYYGPVEGRIVAIDRSQSDATRLTLDQLRLENLAPDFTPARVRISLHGEHSQLFFEPGQRIATTAHLSPPSGPAEPDGFDFQRQAWFQRLGAVGYTRAPVLLAGPPNLEGWTIDLARIRARLSATVREQLPGRAGGFAAAITTGDRSEIEREILDNLRAANLAHLLAISGLHMGLLTGFVFLAVRTGFALSGTSLRRSGKKIASCAALVSGASYLALSGGNVATERAYVMVAVMFVAVLANRRAVTLRAVAIAALFVLVLRPETLLGPGFQMSFAATVALVATYRWLREKGWSLHGWHAWARMIGGVALSSIVAGLATAPFAAAHFNQVPHYGLAANILSVPLMGLIIMPAAVIAAILGLFGFSWIGLALMKWPILWILEVAGLVARFPGSVSHVIAPGPEVIPLLALGGLWIAIWRGGLRLAGVGAVALAFVLWSQSIRPDILIADTGGLVGVMTERGRAVTKPRGDGFSARAWLENDGDDVEQTYAFDRLGVAAESRIEVLSEHGTIIIHASGKRAAMAAAQQCARADFLVVNVSIEVPEGCQIIDPTFLRETGSLAVFTSADGRNRIVSARDRQGRRLWSQ